MQRAWSDVAHAAALRAGAPPELAAAAAREAADRPREYFARMTATANAPARPLALTRGDLETLARYTDGDRELRNRVRVVLADVLPRGVRANRRWRALRAREADGFFSLAEIRRRDPRMYQLYVGKYEAPAATGADTDHQAGPPSSCAAVMTMAERVIAGGDSMIEEMDAQARVEADAGTTTAGGRGRGPSELDSILACVRTIHDPTKADATPAEQRTSALLHGLCDAVKAAQDGSKAKAAAKQQRARGLAPAAPVPTPPQHLEDVAERVASMALPSEGTSVDARRDPAASAAGDSTDVGARPTASVDGGGGSALFGAMDTPVDAATDVADVAMAKDEGQARDAERGREGAPPPAVKKHKHSDPEDEEEDFRMDFGDDADGGEWGSSDDEWLDAACGGGDETARAVAGSGSRGPNEGTPQKRPRAPPTEAEQEEYTLQLIDAMKQRFLCGAEPDVDYLAIDVDDALDDARAVAQDDEDAYFREEGAGASVHDYHTLVQRLQAAGHDGVAG